MAAEVMNYGTPENQKPRDPDADGLKAVRARIAEYQREGFDTAFLEERETAMVNRSKGRRNVERPDRSDSKNDDDLKKAAEAEAKRLAEEEKEKAKLSQDLENKSATNTPDQAAVPQGSQPPAKKVAPPAKKSPAPAAPASDKK